MSDFPNRGFARAVNEGCRLSQGEWFLLLNPDTGQPGWQWQAVEAGFWGNPDINSGGGLWFPPAIDTQQARGSDPGSALLPRC